MSLDPELLNYAATDRQREILLAVIDHGGQRSAAKALGVRKSVVDRVVSQAAKRAAMQGYAPDYDMTRPVPDGFKLRGTSTLYDDQGNQRLQWVKTSADEQRRYEIMREAVQAMQDSVSAVPPVKRAPAATRDDLLNCYIITDYHLGMLAWHEETRGDNWDTAIAKDLMVRWFELAIAQSPDTRTGVFAQIGDLLHWDGLEAVTPTSHNSVDADTRFQALVRAAIHVVRQVIGMLLHKHEYVHVIMAEGNHDIASSVWLRELFTALYDNEPRVTVDDSADPYYCYEFGQTSLFFHHGHKRKPSDIDDVFVSKFREVFGRTKYSYAHMGHKHHSHHIDSNLMKVEQHRTLAPMDAHASRGGWTADREASVITYHRNFGQVGRNDIKPEMVQMQQDGSCAAA